jgi:hypothetical protein
MVSHGRDQLLLWSVLLGLVGAVTFGIIVVDLMRSSVPHVTLEPNDASGSSAARRQMIERRLQLVPPSPGVVGEYDDSPSGMGAPSPRVTSPDIAPPSR